MSGEHRGEETEARRTIIEYTGPFYRLLAVGLVAVTVLALGRYFRETGLADAFATVTAISLAGGVSHWARRRPDRLRLRLGPFWEFGEAALRSADRIKAWTYDRSLLVGLVVYALYGIGIVILKSLIVVALANLYSWLLVVAAVSAVAAYVAAPDFFASLLRGPGLARAEPEAVGPEDEVEDEVERRRRLREERDDQPGKRAEGEE